MAGNAAPVSSCGLIGGASRRPRPRFFPLIRDVKDRRRRVLAALAAEEWIRCFCSCGFWGPGPLGFWLGRPETRPLVRNRKDRRGSVPAALAAKEWIRRFHFYGFWGPSPKNGNLKALAEGLMGRSGVARSHHREQMAARGKRRKVSPGARARNLAERRGSVGEVASWGAEALHGFSGSERSASDQTTSTPMLRAVPAMDLAAASMSLAFMSWSFCFAISRI